MKPAPPVMRYFAGMKHLSLRRSGEWTMNAKDQEQVPVDDVKDVIEEEEDDELIRRARSRNVSGTGRGSPMCLLHREIGTYLLDAEGLHHPTIGSDAAAIECGSDFLGLHRWQRETAAGYLRPWRVWQRPIRRKLASTPKSL